MSDNPHSYKQPIKSEKLWTSYNPYTSKKTQTSNNKSTYYVGQDLEEGYVVTLNDSRTHGLIVTKSSVRSKPNSKLPSSKSATKYKWRMPTEKELLQILNTLKNKFPDGEYLAYNGPGQKYKSVSLYKKNVRTATLSTTFTYHILYVAEF